MKLYRIFAAALLTLAMSLPAMAQDMGEMGAPPQGEQPDQVEQLAEMIGLSDDQKEEIRALLEEMEGDIESKQAEIQELQQRMQGHIQPDFDEDEIRSDADRLGKLTGEMTAKTVLLQAKVEGIFTEEQREELERQMQQQQQQMQDMQQQMQ